MSTIKTEKNDNNYVNLPSFIVVLSLRVLDGISLQYNLAKRVQRLFDVIRMRSTISYKTRTRSRTRHQMLTLSNECLRPYHKESTGSRLITEVKPCRAKLVLGWVTA